MPDSPPYHLNERTKVNLSVVAFATLILAIVGHTIIVVNLYRDIVNQVEALKRETSSSYPMSQAAEDALRNAIGNPGVRFSDPRNPGHYVVVESGRLTTER